MSDNPQGTQPKRRKKRRVTAPAAKDDGPVDVIQDILDSSSGDYEMSVPVLPDDSAAPPAASAPPSDIPVAPVNDNPIDDYMPSTAEAMANFVLDNFLGIYSRSAKKKKKKVPANHTIHHTARGQFFLTNLADQIGRADEARNEHLRPGATTPYRSSFGLLAEKFGEGVFQYFDFLVFLVISNAIMLLPGVISMISHFALDPFVNAELQKNFYILMFTSKSYKFWWWPMAIMCIVVLLTFGPWIALRIAMRFKKKGIVDYEDEFVLPTAADVVRDKSGLAINPRKFQVKRYVLSYFLFFLLLVTSGILTVGFVAAQYYAFNNTFLGSILVSVVVSIINAIWAQICTVLTLIEAHYTWSSFKNHHTLKLFVWKLLNVCLMFLGQWLVTRCYLAEVPIWSWIYNISNKNGIFESPLFSGGSPTAGPTAPSFPPTYFTPLYGTVPDFPLDPSFNASAPYTSPSSVQCVPGCELGNLGNQFLSLLIADLILDNAMRILWPYFGWKLYGWFTRKHTSPESEDGRIEFDLAMNYLDLLYRQFIVYLGTPFVPFLPIVGIVLNLLQIPIDKLRLLWWCKTPPRLSGSMKHFLVFFLMISAVFSIGVFPYGTGWVLSGFTLKTSCPSSMFGKNSNSTIA